jgi:hypothetical protein
MNAAPLLLALAACNGPDDVARPKEQAPPVIEAPALATTEAVEIQAPETVVAQEPTPPSIEDIFLKNREVILSTANAALDAFDQTQYMDGYKAEIPEAEAAENRYNNAAWGEGVAADSDRGYAFKKLEGEEGPRCQLWLFEQCQDVQANGISAQVCLQYEVPMEAPSADGDVSITFEQEGNPVELVTEFHLNSVHTRGNTKVQFSGEEVSVSYLDRNKAVVGLGEGWDRKEGPSHGEIDLMIRVIDTWTPGLIYQEVECPK